jgi:hypothetical protein
MTSALISCAGVPAAARDPRRAVGARGRPVHGDFQGDKSVPSASWPVVAYLGRRVAAQFKPYHCPVCGVEDNVTHARWRRLLTVRARSDVRACSAPGTSANRKCAERPRRHGGPKARERTWWRR